MPLLPSILIWACGASFMICIFGVLLCYDVMLEEVQGRLPEGQKIKHPYLSNKFYEIVRLHGEFYPQSRLRSATRFLFRILAITFLVFISLAWFISRGTQHS